MTWDIAFWIAGAASFSLFVLQGVFWAALRSRRISLATWKTRTRLWLAAGSLLMAAGSALWLFGPDTFEVRKAAYAALVGGGLNTFEVVFHRRVISWLTRPRR